MTAESRKSSWRRLPFVEVAGKIVKYFGGWLLAGLLTAIGALMFFGWLADEVFEGDTKNFDDSVRAYIHGFASPLLTVLMKSFSFVGSPLVISVFGGIVISAFLFLKWKRALILFLITMLGEIALSLTLKEFFKRTRPDAFFNYPLPSSFSFPSGHALGSFCFFGIMAWLITARLENKWLKIIIWISTIFLVSAIGVSRIYLGVHYPSDVLAGYTTGLFWIMTVANTDFWLQRRTERLQASTPKDSVQ